MRGHDPHNKMSKKNKNQGVLSKEEKDAIRDLSDMELVTHFEKLDLNAKKLGKRLDYLTKLLRDRGLFRKFRLSQEWVGKTRFSEALRNPVFTEELLYQKNEVDNRESCANRKSLLRYKPLVTSEEEKNIRKQNPSESLTKGKCRYAPGHKDRVFFLAESNDKSSLITSTTVHEEHG